MRVGDWIVPDLGAVVFFDWDRSIKRGRVSEVRATPRGVFVEITHRMVDGDRLCHVVPIDAQWASPVDAANAVFGAAPEPAL